MMQRFTRYNVSGSVNECSKVRNRPVVYSRREAGASVYFGHVSS